MANEYSPIRASSPSAVAKRKGVSRSKLYEEMKSGRLKSVKLRGNRLITEEQEDDWFRSYMDQEAAA